MFRLYEALQLNLHAKIYTQTELHYCLLIFFTVSAFGFSLILISFYQTSGHFAHYQQMTARL